MEFEKGAGFMEIGINHNGELYSPLNLFIKRKEENLIWAILYRLFPAMFYVNRSF